MSRTIFSYASCGTEYVSHDPRDEEIWKKHEPVFSRKELPLPSASEGQVIRHYTLLSRKAIGVDTTFYPLGSCTMKYNPKVSEHIASDTRFLVHPALPPEHVQGNLSILYELEQRLCYLLGFDACTLQPAAGAHGELTALFIIKRYFEEKGETRTKIIIPDSAHGTNPASAALAGFEVISIPSRSGMVDEEALARALSHDVAAVMITNPNTLGLFEKRIVQVAQKIHEQGALLYGDGANMNAMIGVVRPGDLGFDIMHVNLHKTFSTPHGGGGPGAGPVCVKRALAPYLPFPRVIRTSTGYRFEGDRQRSIGKVRAFFGNFTVLLKAYVYLCALGSSIRRVAEIAVLNANYLRKKVAQIPGIEIPFDGLCAHEFVAKPTDEIIAKGIHTTDIAKRLIDKGFHPPTIYFPLIVPEAMMIEPTETETKETLDSFVNALEEIFQEIEKEPAKVQNAPVETPVGRLDGVKAARQPIVKEPYIPLHTPEKK